MNASWRKSRSIFSIVVLICLSLLLSSARVGSAHDYLKNYVISERNQNIIFDFDNQIDCNWDSSAVQKPGVLWDSEAGVYKMWFDGIDPQGIVKIGLATSDDGISWEKYSNNPVLSGNSGAWDESSGEHAPFVLKENDTYKMWYEGSGAGGPRQLGYAISTNGIDWFKYSGNPILQAGPETYDQDVAGHGSVLKDGSTYKLWYHAIGDQGAIIAYATSPDGYNWTKQGPVFTPDPGDWETALWGPSVLKIEGLYWMWYAAGREQDTAAIGVATSTNGTDWNRFGTGPILTEEGSTGDPQVIYKNGKFHMWYNNFDHGAIHYAESDDGVNWSKSPSNPVLRPGSDFCAVFLPLAMLNP